MPHIVTFDGLFARQAGFQKPEDFLKLGDIKGEFQADELTGGFDALNETTNVRPAKGESISIVHPEFRTGLINPDSIRPVDFGSFEPRQAILQEASANDDLTGRKGLNWGELCDVGLSLRQADELTGSFDALNETTNVRPAEGESISIVHPTFRTCLINPDSMRPDDSRSETLGDGNPRILGPLSGNGVFKPQDIDTKGSVIVGDNHFTPDRGGDSLTGEGRPNKIWRNAGPSTFEDRVFGGFDANDFHACPNIHLDTEAPSMSMHQGAMNSVWAKDLAGNFLDAAGNITDPCEPAVGMNSFGESRNPVLETGACNGYDCTNAGSCSNPAVLKAMVGSTSGLGGMSF